MLSTRPTTPGVKIITDRGPGRVRHRRHRADPGQRGDRRHLRARACARSCARTPTRSWSARSATARPRRSRSRPRLTGPHRVLDAAHERRAARDHAPGRHRRRAVPDHRDARGGRRPAPRAHASARAASTSYVARRGGPARARARRREPCAATTLPLRQGLRAAATTPATAGGPASSRSCTSTTGAAPRGPRAAPRRPRSARAAIACGHAHAARERPAPRSPRAARRSRRCCARRCLAIVERSAFPRPALPWTDCASDDSPKTSPSSASEAPTLRPVAFAHAAQLRRRHGQEAPTRGPPRPAAGAAAAGAPQPRARRAACRRSS